MIPSRRPTLWALALALALAAALALSAPVPHSAPLLPTASGSRGREIFHRTARPACVACHNARTGSLEHSQATPKDVEAWIRNGRKGKMPAYRFRDDDLRALIGYVMSLRKK